MRGFLEGAILPSTSVQTSLRTEPSFARSSMNLDRSSQVRLSFEPALQSPAARRIFCMRSSQVALTSNSSIRLNAPLPSRSNVSARSASHLPNRLAPFTIPFSSENDLGEEATLSIPRGGRRLAFSANRAMIGDSGRQIMRDTTKDNLHLLAEGKFTRPGGGRTIGNGSSESTSPAPW